MVLLINGSPNEEGATAEALSIIEKRLNALGIRCSRINVPLGICCLACRACADGGGCVHKEIREASELFMAAEGVIIATPVYFSSPTGSLISFLDCLFMSSKFDKSKKVGASFSVSRRAGATSCYDVINKYFGISGMPIASSNYWNLIRAGTKDEVALDTEGVGCAELLAERVAFLIKAIALTQEDGNKTISS